MEKEIRGFLKKARRRLGIKELLYRLIKGGIGAFTLGLFMVLISFLIPIYKSYQMAIIGVIIVLIGTLMIAIFKMPNNQKTALIVDEQGLEERLITSLELLDKKDSVSRLQKENTVNALRQYRISERLPWALPKKQLFLLGLLGGLFIISGFIPNSMNEKAEERHQLETLKKEKEKTIEALKETLEEKGLLEELKQEEIEEILENALNEIDEALSKEEIEKELARLDKKLEQQGENEEKEVIDLLNEMRQTLSPENEALKQDLAQMDMEKIQEVLSENDMLKQLNQALNHLSVEGLEDTLNDLSDKLQNMTQEEIEALINSLETLGRELNDEQLSALIHQLTEEIKNGTISNELAEQISQKMGQLSQQADPTGTASLSTGQQTQGETHGQSEGQEEGQGQGTGQGEGQNSGTGTGTGWNHGSEQGFQRDIGENTTSEEVYIQERDLGEDDNLTGSRTSEGQRDIQEGGEALTSRGVSVDYQEVLSEYTEQAMATMYERNIPESLKGSIKEYFEALNE